MNKFKGILVLGTSVNAFCGCYGVKLADITIDGTTDVTDNVKGDDSMIEYASGTGLKFGKEDFGTNVKVFRTSDGKYIIVGTSTIFNKQEEAVKKFCVKLDDSDCYLNILGFDEEAMKKVTITKDDKVKGKYKVTIQQGGEEEGGEEGGGEEGEEAV